MQQGGGVKCPNLKDRSESATVKMDTYIIYIGSYRWQTKSREALESGVGGGEEG